MFYRKLFLISIAAVSIAGSVGVQPASAAVAPAGTGAPSAAAATSPAALDPKEAGPQFGAVDPQYASPEAAAKTMLQHQAHAGHTAGGPGRAAGLQAPSLAAAALDPKVYGQWAKLGYNTQSRSVHVTLLYTGRVLLVAGSGNRVEDTKPGSLKAHVWNPATGAMKAVPPPYDMFCAGHVTLSNGDVFIMGGTAQYRSASPIDKWSGAKQAYKFNVRTETWTALPPMADGRWYPTPVINGAGTVDVYGGYRTNGEHSVIPERYDPITNTWKAMPRRAMPMYAGLTLMANGSYYYSGAHDGSSRDVTPGIFSPNGGAKLTVPGLTTLEQRKFAMSSLVGDANQQLVWIAGGGFPAVATTHLTDLKPAAPATVAGPKLPTAKGYVSLVNLPDLKVLETGGGTGIDTPVYESSLFDPARRTIMPMAAPLTGRTYHSSAILLPDGSVAAFGGDPTGPAFDMSIEIFKPPYLFKGTRPTVPVGATEVAYGSSHAYATKASAATLSSAVLARPMSVTHSTDANQRTVKLAATVTSTGMTVKLPTNRNIAPPGWYMLYVNDSLGRPSAAKWVHLN